MLLERITNSQVLKLKKSVNLIASRLHKKQKLFKEVPSLSPSRH